jgi:hypothetical protein
LSSVALRAIHLNRATCTLTAYEGDAAVLHVPACVGEDNEVGAYSFTAQAQSAISGRYHGVPWITIFGEIAVRGAYWHNRFGALRPGPGIDIPPAAARWLYRWANEWTRFTIL